MNIFIFFLATRYQECIGEILHVRLRCASKLRCTAFCARGSSFRHFTLSVQLSHGETPLSCLWIAEPQNICPGSRAPEKRKEKEFCFWHGPPEMSFLRKRHGKVNAQKAPCPDAKMAKRSLRCKICCKNQLASV